MTTEGSVSEEDANQMLKDLQSWWEIPATAQYISLFRESFHLPETEIEELEKAFIDDTIKGPSTWLQNLLFAFVKSIIPGRGVNAENWELHLRKLIKRKCPVGDINPFDEDKSFQELTLRAKVLIVYSLCLHRLDRYDIADTMKSMDADALRVQKLGVDGIGNTYWYFYGTRLYKEEVEKKKTWDEEWKQQKKKSFKKRGRGRPRKRRTSDGESDGFEDVDKKDDGFMNVNEKSRWSVVCDTIEEWVNFAEKFKDSKSKDEAHLFKIIQENFLPTLNKIYEEKEKKLQQKIKELMPTREKIVTRRETRRLRGEDLDISPFVNGYDLYSSDETRSSLPGKSRAQRLEERNKRAIEAEDIQVVGQKKTKKNNSEYDSPARQPSESSDDDLQSRMEKLIAEIKLHKDAWPFLYPVSEEDAPGYYDIIKEPIDLSTIESRLFKGEYDTLGELYEDISKMVENCELYNGEFHNLSKMGQMLRLAFKKKLAEILESIELEQFQNADSEGSRDSHSHSGSNSNSALHSEEAASDSSSNASKKSKDRKKKKKKRAANALDLLAEATQLAVQDNYATGKTSPPQKKSPVPQHTQVASTNVPSNSMPYIPTSASSSDIPNKNFTQAPQRERLIMRVKVPEKRKPTNAAATFNGISSASTHNVSPQNNAVLPQNNIEPAKPKNVPLVYAYSNNLPTTQSDLRYKLNPAPVVSVQSNMCMPQNSLPVVQQVQQVLIPTNAQHIQLQNNGQFVFTAPQNTVRLITKEQTVQMLNSGGQVNQGFGKVMPQFVTTSPQVLQVSKDGMHHLQFQAVPQNNTQEFTQVTQSPQFTYMLTNQNGMNESSPQSVMNLQPYQLQQRQMHIGGQGNV